MGIRQTLVQARKDSREKIKRYQEQAADLKDQLDDLPWGHHLRMQIRSKINNLKTKILYEKAQLDPRLKPEVTGFEYRIAHQDTNRKYY